MLKFKTLALLATMFMAALWFSTPSTVFADSCGCDRGCDCSEQCHCDEECACDDECDCEVDCDCDSCGVQD